MRRGAALGVLAAAATLGRIPPARAADLTPVRIGGGLNDDMTPVLYGMQAGIFRGAGLDVQLKSSAVGAALASAVVGGTLDIAKSSLMALISGYDHGIRFKICAGGAMYTAKTPTSDISVLKSSNVRSVADAGGKTIACSSLRALDQLGMQALIDKSGGDSSTVRFIELPYSTMLGALEKGSADVAMIGVPVLATALETGEIRTLGDPFAGIGDPVLIAGWFCTQDFAAKNASVVQRFAEAVREATTYTNAHHAETVALLAEYSHIEPELIRKMQRGTNAASVSGRVIQPAIDVAAKYKYITRSFPASELLAAGAA